MKRYVVASKTWPSGVDRASPCAPASWRSVACALLTLTTVARRWPLPKAKASMRAIAVTGRIDRLLINQNSVDHPAHLDQLLPISAVASETRDLARGDGANLAKTHLRHHPLKAG